MSDSPTFNMIFRDAALKRRAANALPKGVYLRDALEYCCRRIVAGSLRIPASLAARPNKREQKGSK